MATGTVHRSRQLTTRSFALGRAESVTGIAGVVSTSAYLRYGHPYLRYADVVGDLLGFLVIAAVALAAGRRLRHEAALCLLLIGAVVLVHPTWPLPVSDTVSWLLFFGARVSYVGVRRHVCD